jgi:hypothetical protein
MSKPLDITISAKNLGAMMLEDACERCFWIKNKLKVPWQIFPGIFSSIDSYTKKAVHAWFDHFKEPPPWIPALKNAVDYLPTPHWKKYFRTDPLTGITVRTVADDIMRDKDGCIIIPDYKTAKWTKNQDKLLPMYEVQQNASAWIQQGFGDRVVAIPLVYCEPQTSPDVWGHLLSAEGFSMEFKTHQLDIEINPRKFAEVLSRAKGILSLNEPPPKGKGCKDCAQLGDIIEALNWAIDR